MLKKTSKFIVKSSIRRKKCFILSLLFILISIQTGKAARIDLIKSGGNPVLPDGTPFENTPLGRYTYRRTAQPELAIYRWQGDKNINNLFINSISKPYNCICESIIVLE